MVIMPGQSVTVSVPMEKQPDGSYAGSWKEGDPIELVHGELLAHGEPLEVQDISREVFGKYQFGTMHWGLWYSDEDFVGGGGCGPLKWGAVPAPGSPDRRPWRGVLVELIRRAMGAPRERRM